MAPVVASRGETAYLELPCRSLLNRCTSERMPFEWTINPYRGCEFGCGYCYARYTHEYMGMEDTRLFETRIYAKRAAAEALERDLSRPSSRTGAIAIGTATDPYQPAERRMKITRSLLEVFARKEGLRLSITTKGTLVTRDVDLLRRIAERNDLSINVTITTLSRRIARLLEPRAPRPGKRLEAVRALSQAGLRTGVFIMPVIPGLTDAPASLDALVGAAARAGAATVAHQVLFLRDSARREFFPMVRKAYPRLASHLRRAYAADVYYSADYRERLDELMRTLRRKHGLHPRREPGDSERRQPTTASARWEEPPDKGRSERMCGTRPDADRAGRLTTDEVGPSGGAALVSASVQETDDGERSRGATFAAGAMSQSACVAGGAVAPVLRGRRFARDPQLPLAF